MKEISRRHVEFCVRQREKAITSHMLKVGDEKGNINSRDKYLFLTPLFTSRHFNKNITDLRELSSVFSDGTTIIGGREVTCSKLFVAIMMHIFCYEIQVTPGLTISFYFLLHDVRGSWPTEVIPWNSCWLHNLLLF